MPPQVQALATAVAARFIDSRMSYVAKPVRCFSLSLACFLLVAAATLYSPPAVGQTFSDYTAAAGINHTQFVTPDDWWDFTEPRIITGGVAARDYDGDGFVDLIFTRLDAPPVLYRNQGNGTFQVIDPSASGITVPHGSNGATWGDINNNGHPDLYITTVDNNRNFLYINNGDGSFTEQALDRNVALPGKGPSYSATFGDINNNGYLDLFTASWFDFGNTGTRLLQNEGASNPGHFTDVTVSAGVDMGQYETYYGLSGATWAFSPRFADLNGNGHVDLAIASDFGTSQLFWNNGDGTFTNGTAAAGVGIDNNGMGSAIGDFTGNGHLDWFVSSIFDGEVPPGANWGNNGSQLYANQGDGTFVATAVDTYWGWGSTFFDYDNSGNLDLVVTNGFNIPSEISDIASHFEDKPTLLFRNDGGNLTDVTFDEGIFHFGSGRGLLVADFNNNGKLDLVIVDNQGMPVLYLNESPLNNDWVGFNTIGALSNADGFGTWITVTVDGVSQVFEVNAGSNFLGQNDKRAHFGLGQTDGIIDMISVAWPSGITQEFFDVPANAYYTLHELDGLSLSYPVIPEPSTIALAAIAALLLAGRGLVRRKSRASKA